MAKQNDIRIECYIRMAPDASPVPFHSLTAPERDAVRETMRNRLSQTMSSYYTQHMDEYQKLKL